MSYVRVLPRDLFNEAKLLKCIGQIALLVHDRKISGLQVVAGRCFGFIVEQDESDGSIGVANVDFRDPAGRLVHFRTRMNSQAPYPVVMTYLSEDYEPLNEHGEWVLPDDLFLRGG